MSSHNPLDVPVDWFVDVPASSADHVLAQTAEWDRKLGTQTSRSSNGGDLWTRLRIFGKPLAIHYLISNIVQVSKCLEVGYAPESPFPTDFAATDDIEADVMPVYHAAWSEFMLSKQNRH